MIKYYAYLLFKRSNSSYIVFCYCLSTCFCAMKNFMDLAQGIIDPTGTETFAKQPKLAKLLRELKPMPVSCNKKDR